MKNLKIISLYKIIFVIFIISLGITYHKIRTTNKTNEEDKKIQIKGYINNIEIKDERIEIELISENKTLVNYENKTNELYKLGDEIIVEGILKQPSKNTILNVFNYKNYLLSKNIKYILNAEKIIKIKETNKIQYKIKNTIIEHINKYQTRNYLKTFLLGDNSEINENIIKTYQNNGISHLFAVSGMHLSLFSAILLYLLRKLKINDNINYILISIFFVFFSFLTNYSPSILRALFMYILLGINKIFNLNIKTQYILIFIFSCLLLYNPFYIYNIGFLFSFIVSFFIIIYQHIINNQKTYLKKLFMTSFIAFLSSIPIMFQNFFKLNLLTPLINIIFVPIVSFVIFPLSLMTCIFKPLDNIFILLINILEFLSTIINKINIDITLAHCPWYIVFIYYIVIICFIKGIHIKDKRKLIPLIMCLIIHYNIKYIIPTSKITMIDVSQGDSTLIELSHNKGNILIDTGGNFFNNKSLLSKVTNYLVSNGINKLDYLIITHGDYDHMGEAINLVNNFKVEKVIFNCGEFNDLEQELIKVLDTKKIPYYSCIKELNIDNNKLYFLNNKDYGNENDNSSVVYTELNGYKFMFMGDAGVDVEEDLIEKYNLQDLDVLKVGHHGSKTSSSKKFINEINPKYSVISVGKNNRYGHPNDSVLDKLEDSKIYRTDQDGSILFKIKKDKLKIETCTP